MKQHAFVIPAWGESPHLRNCLESLRTQTRPSPIMICTSTPYAGLDRLASEFGARLVTHSPNAGIGHDWNMALENSDAEWTTIAHQDDIYLPHFSEATIAAVERNPDARLVMTGYAELIDDRARTLTPMLAIKRLLQELAFLGREAISNPGAKRRLLRFGCAIPCPAVTLRTERGQGSRKPRFREDLRLNLDWHAWLCLAREDGAFARVRRTSMLHRIHADSQTSDGIRAGLRAREDLMMFSELWPLPIARLLARIYSLAYEAAT